MVRRIEHVMARLIFLKKFDIISHGDVFILFKRHESSVKKRTIFTFVTNVDVT